MRRLFPVLVLFSLPALAETTPYMSLVLPTPGVTAGPTYAQMLNTAFGLVDSHTHATGYGQRIPSAGININADLSFHGFNATVLRTVRLYNNASAPATASDRGIVYELGGELYYKDASGNAVQLTCTGAICDSGTDAGVISGLVSPATASYNSGTGTFTWKQNASDMASMECGPITIHDTSGTATAVSIQPPAALASSWTLTLPAGVPSPETAALVVNTSGEASYAYAADVDPSSGFLTLVNGSVDTDALHADAVTTDKILNANVTRAKLVAVGQQFSGTPTTQDITSASYVDLTDVSGNPVAVTITTTGRPIVIAAVPTGVSGYFQLTGTSNPMSAGLQIYSTGSAVGTIFETLLAHTASTFSITQVHTWPPSSVFTVYAHAAGTFTFTLQGKRVASGSTLRAQYIQLVAYEL